MGGKVLDLDVIRAYKEGKAEGIAEGNMETWIQVFIEDKVEDGFATATIIERLRKYFHLERCEAEAYIKKYAPSGYDF